MRRLLTAPASPALHVSLSDRWFVPGFTGTGKTTFSKRLLEEMRRLYPVAQVYVLDSKGNGDFDGWPGEVETDEPPDPLSGPGGVQVWRPSLDDLPTYDEWFHKLLRGGFELTVREDGQRRVKRPKILLIDELSSICTRSGETVAGFQKLLKQGRGLWESVIVLTQEIAYIPRQVRNQTTHIVRFRLNDDYDSRKVDALIGHKERHEPQKTFGFWYARVDTPRRRAIEYDGWQDFFGPAQTAA